MIAKKIKGFNLKTRIILLLAVGIFMIISVIIIVFNEIYHEYEYNLLSQERIKSLYSLDASLDGMINNADNCSKSMIADLIVQKQMSIGDLNSSTGGQQMVINKAYSILQFSEGVDAIWFIDKKGQRLQIGNYVEVYEGADNGIYNDLKKAYGSPRMTIDRKNNSSLISLVRAYNSTSDFKTLGIIGVDISAKYLEQLVSKNLELDNERLLIIKDDGSVVFWNASSAELLKHLNMVDLNSFENGNLINKIAIDKEELMATGIISKEHEWKIIRFTPSDHIKNSEGLKELMVLIIIITGVLVLIIASLASGTLASPIQSMLRAMQDTEEGIPSKLEETPSLNELQILFSGYNQMVDRIRQLIDDTIWRQQRIREVELYEIQEQMKPHFLYNTLDAIEALAMIGDTDTVCRLIEAMGKFYRRLVSGGREFLTIDEEVKMVREYSEIMRIRFGDTFNYEINCEESCKGYLIPKLTIQPLVENAFQHGLRARVGHGKIKVDIKRQENRVHIRIDDNGVGIPEEIVKELTDEKYMEKHESLGLRGTLKRLRLIYGKDFSYEVAKEGPSCIDIYIYEDALKRV